MLRLRWDACSSVLENKFGFTTGVTICLNLRAAISQLPNVMMSKETVTRHTIALRKCLWQRAETETGTHKKGYAESYGRPVRATQSYRRMMHLRKKLLREREREREPIDSIRRVYRRVESSSRGIVESFSDML